MKKEPNIGSSEIHGEAIGDKEETSDSSEEPTTLVSKVLAHGPLPLIHGLKMLETKQKLASKIYHLDNTLNTKDLAKEFLLKECQKTLFHLDLTNT